MATDPRAARWEYLKSKRAQRSGVGKRPSGIPRSTLLPSPLPLVAPFTLFRRPSLSGIRGEPGSPARPRSSCRSAFERRGAGPRAPGGREGRDAVQCCSFPANIALVPASGPSGPPASPSPRAGQPQPSSWLLIPADLRETGVSPLPPWVSGAGRTSAIPRPAPRPSPNPHAAASSLCPKLGQTSSPANFHAAGPAPSPPSASSLLSHHPGNPLKEVIALA